MAGNDEGQAPIFDALRRLAVTPEQRIDVDDMRVVDLNNEGRPAEAETLARRTLAAARHLNYEAGVAAVMSSLSYALSFQGRLPEALAVVEAYWPVVERLPDADPTHFNSRAMLLDNLGRPLEAIPLHQQAFERLMRRGDATNAMTSLGNLAVSFTERGQLRAAQRSLARLEALRSAHDAGDGIGVTFMLVAIGVERGLGCHTQALAWAQRAQEHLERDLSGYLPLVGMGRAAVWTELGQLARAQQSLPAAAAIAGLPPWLAARRLQYAARLRQALGHDALDSVAAAAQLIGDDTLRSVRESVTLQLASLRGTAADLDAIVALGDAARQQGREGIALAADLRAAELAAALGMHHAAMHHAGRARQALGDDRDGDAAVSAADLSDAEAWLMLARAFKACSRDADAVDGLARGLAWVASVAVEQVPAEFLDSFLHRNAAHRELLTAAAREPTLAGSLAALRSLALSR